MKTCGLQEHAIPTLEDTGCVTIQSTSLFYHYDSLYVKVGFTKGGKLLALDMKLYSNAGNSIDLSLPVG